MTATIHPIYGLRGPNLAAFERAMAIVESHARADDPEDALRQMRAHLAAALLEPTYQRGEARVAMAANKLAASLLLSERT